MSETRLLRYARNDIGDFQQSRSFCLKISTISIINLVYLNMVAKTMVQQKFCQECNQRHTPLETPKKSLTGHECRKVYEQLGNTKSPSVVLKVVASFLLPLVVFIATLAAFEKILARVIPAKELQTVVSFVLAVSVAFALILIIKAINKRLAKNR